MTYRDRVGKGFPTHGPCQEGWERDFPPMGRVKKGGKGISHPRIVSHGPKKGGKGISGKKGGKGISHPWAVSRRVGKGFPTHGSCQEGWERDFPPTDPVSRRVGKGFPTHGSCQEGWERDFRVSRRVGKGFPTHGSGCFGRLRWGRMLRLRFLVLDLLLEGLDLC